MSIQFTFAVGIDEPSTPTVQESDFYVSQSGLYLIDATSGPVTTYLPTAAQGNAMEIKLKKTDATVNAITITPASGELVDGNVNFDLLYENEAVTLRSDGSNWFIV